jgi:hypothetical protein
LAFTSFLAVEIISKVAKILADWVYKNKNPYDKIRSGRVNFTINNNDIFNFLLDLIIQYRYIYIYI